MGNTENWENKIYFVLIKIQKEIGRKDIFYYLNIPLKYLFRNHVIDTGKHLNLPIMPTHERKYLVWYGKIYCSCVYIMI